MKNQTFLVTGAAGFIGARFVESCVLQGIEVISVDHLSFFEEREENRQLNFGRKVDRSELFDWLETNPLPIRAIVHLGAITDTRSDDLELLNQLNFGYSQSLWNFAVKAKIPFFYASSAATYGDGSLGYDDDEKLIPSLKPLNLYGDSKQKFDLWALEQEKAGSSPPFWAGFKFFNVYGYGERHKGFMSSVVLHAYDQIMESGQVTLFKSHRAGIPDGYQKRDFISVNDVVKVLHFAINKPIRRGILNLGTGQARPFLDLAHSVFDALGMTPKIQFKDTPLNIRNKYQYFTEAKMDHLRSEGYTSAFTSLEDGVAEYVKRLKERT